MNVSNIEEARASVSFLQKMYPSIPEGMSLLVWTMPDKISHWFDRHPTQKEINDIAEKHDVYYGLLLARQGIKDTRRATGKDVRAMFGVWLDIDYGKEHHKKSNLPDTYDEALAWVVKYNPSVVVHSGHGFHAYWLFDDTWILADDAERAKAAIVSKTFSNRMKSDAAALGWGCDSTWDLARVLRVPGTMNRKGDPVPVSVVFECDNRLAREDFVTKMLLQENAVPAPKPMPDNGACHTQEGAEPEVVICGNLRLASDSAPDAARFDALYQNNERFKQTWHRKRKPGKDDSPSGYDMSLACFAVSACWEDQDVVSLLIAHRRMHGDPLKLRQDYYANTVKAARHLLRDRITQNTLSALHQSKDEVKTPEEKKERRASIIKAVSDSFGVTITRIEKFMSDTPEYTLCTDKGDVPLGDANGILNHTKFQAALASVTGHVIRPYKRDEWWPIAQNLFDICIEVQIGEEATATGRMRIWLSEYLGRSSVETDATKRAEAIHNSTPFVYNGEVHIFGSRLRDWVRVTHGEAISFKEMGKVMTMLGANPRNNTARIGARRVDKATWVLPEKYLEAVHGREGSKEAEEPRTCGAETSEDTGEVGAPIQTTLHQ